MSEQEYVTFRIGSQVFGVGVTDIHDVFRPSGMTNVPRSPGEIAGVLNLRGRIVTAIDARARLGLPPLTVSTGPKIAVSVEKDGESFGLIIDEIGEVVRMDVADLEENPVNLDATWAGVSKGVYRLEDRLLVIMDIDRMLARPSDGETAAAA